MPFCSLVMLYTNFSDSFLHHHTLFYLSPALSLRRSLFLSYYFVLFAVICYELCQNCCVYFIHRILKSNRSKFCGFLVWSVFESKIDLVVNSHSGGSIFLFSMSLSVPLCASFTLNILFIHNPVIKSLSHLLFTILLSTLSITLSSIS